MTNDYCKYIPKINLEKFDYDLPKEKIAEFPLEDRDSSKLLFAEANTGKIEHHTFKDISELLPDNSLLVINETKVIAARLKMKKPTGGKAEILCVEPVVPSFDPQLTMQARGECSWKCIIGGRKISAGIILSPESDLSGFELKAEIIEKKANEALVKFTWSPEKLSFAEALETIGKTPLPPYIKREADEKDKNDYQTVYAEKDGSVAAPTAGLHFTDEVLERLKKKGINICRLTLHVGPGTFKPIEADDIAGHEMHSERVFIERKAVDMIIEYLENNDNPNIVTTGTTSLRTLESLYWHGTKLFLGKAGDDNKFELKQWDSYVLENTEKIPSSLESMKTVASLMEDEQMEYISGRTQLFCVPGYNFKMSDSLITNYHMPKSTLVLLVAAYIGEDLWDKAYGEALNNDYRFLSYGDSSLLVKGR